MATYSINRLDAALLWLCILGMGISYYAYVVETNKEKNQDYQPLCDISEHVSCSKAFMSEWGKGFGLIPKDSPFYLPNSVFGIVYYTIMSCLSLFNQQWNTALMLILSIISNLFSIYFARILYLLQDVCVVCVSLYVLNAVILLLTVRKIRAIKTVPAKKKSAKKTK